MGSASHAAIDAPRHATVSDIRSPEDAIHRAETNNMVSPRFYTTDYAYMDRIDIEPVRAEWDMVQAEYEGDNNHDHFQRDASFAAEAAGALERLDEDARREFLDFLVTSLTSEFSGCVLYNEIRQRVENPAIKQLMTWLVRDESRHAGFINATLRDYGLGVNLNELRRNKAYTYFHPKYILYATYLSEKIGYARYITIFRHLEKHPEKRFHPIFRWFERWCNDEFRHGESFALIMRANPKLLEGANLWLIRFFLLAVYATMYVRDHTRPALKRALGLDPTEYDYEVFRITSEIARQVYPVELDVDHPAFRAGLDRLHRQAEAFYAAKEAGGLGGLLGQAWHGARAFGTFVQLYFVPVKHNPLPEQIRVQPVW